MREKHDMKSANKPDGREGLTDLKWFQWMLQWKWRKHKKDHEAFFNLITSPSYFSDKRFRISISPRSSLALWELSKVKQADSRPVEPLGEILLKIGRHAGTWRWTLTEHIWLHLFLMEGQMEELPMSGDWGRWRGRRRRRWTLGTRWSWREFWDWQ